ncbi:MAG: type I DNA topoisomerase [Proteobacteria bacterium]|nr:type I DNA topoisomerase [Pseudomonadota bacterium]
MNKLVIVESPAKAKTIEKYLGGDFKVMASYGHIRDLVPKTGAVKPEEGFSMKYEIIERNEKHLNSIIKALSKSDELILATDPDREGEAISWHLAEELKNRDLLKDIAIKRVVFYEVTKKAVNQSMANPRDISSELVDAQQARRALDYLVGFNLSPLLWKKVHRGLSAGRVQSPALRLIVEREKEIEAFIPQEYWDMDSKLSKDNIEFKARLVRFNNEKLEQFSFVNEDSIEDAKTLILEKSRENLTVFDVKTGTRRRQPTAPFTTSTLQQAASRKLGFTTRRTMSVAQKLYEGIDVGNGTVGLITYMRTDSVSLSNDAIVQARDIVKEIFGDNYLPQAIREYENKSKNAQEAHEGIRPTDLSLTPDKIKKYLSEEQYKLYELIWNKTVASQMKEATYETLRLELVPSTLNDDQILFRASGSVLIDPGFMALYVDDQRDNPEDMNLPKLNKGDLISIEDLVCNQHFTEPPPRYSEASLVKTLEEFGIGRPSTYASIITTLLNREYVELDGRRFMPTDTGRVVSDFLGEHFTKYVDYDFTATLEDDLDAISRGEKILNNVLQEFWGPFIHLLQEKEEGVSRDEALQSRLLGDDPESGKPVSVRLGRFGPYVQIGTREDEEKPKFAGLRPGQSMNNINLDEALALFNLPRLLGENSQGEEIIANIGRFGPYVKIGNEFVSIRGEDPFEITLDRALEMIHEKREADKNKIIKVFDDSAIQVLNGRYGPYITDGNKNAKIPKDREPATLTLEECNQLIAEAPARKKKTKKKRAKKTTQ